ncbi:unnamed protein product [Peronospora farinosa]|uniref:Uncharacterized protein n=1 Tax=Peronospora farinosa TaxID=134698 RepID=A0AAV0U293_9STRA|nr:unnamed protein product [Peronospora farinosa]
MLRRLPSTSSSLASFSHLLQTTRMSSSPASCRAFSLLFHRLQHLSEDFYVVSAARGIATGPPTNDGHKKKVIASGESLCCPQCSAPLVLAEPLSADKLTSSNPSLPITSDTSSSSSTSTSTLFSEFKKGDVVKCVKCNLHFALKAQTSAPSNPTFLNAAAAAALSSLSSSLSPGMQTTRGSNLGGSTYSGYFPTRPGRMTADGETKAS